MPEDVYANAFRELLDSLLRRAEDSKKEVAAALSTGNDEWLQRGRNLAYFEVVDIANRVVEQFELPRSELELSAENPSADILYHSKA